MLCEQIQNMAVLKTIDHIQIKIKVPNPSHEPTASSKASDKDIEDVIYTFKIKRERAKIWNLVVLKTSDHIQIKVKMLSPSQEPPAPTKTLNQDLKDMDDLCTFKIILDSQNSEHWFIKDL